MLYTNIIQVSSQGFCDLIDITAKVESIVKKSGLSDGLACVFVSGSTAGVTTIEYEEGAIQDFKEMMERLVPAKVEYQHNARWGDGNGFSHIRASLLGPSLTVPLVKGELSLGTWQQIVVVDFDNRSRDREVVVQVLGEE